MLAAAVLVPTSLWVTGVQGYNQFYRHTIQVHDETPLTNHMGLRVIIAHKFFDFQAAWPPGRLATARESGRMKYTRDNALNDPFRTPNALNGSFRTSNALNGSFRTSSK